MALVFGSLKNQMGALLVAVKFQRNTTGETGGGRLSLGRAILFRSEMCAVDGWSVAIPITCPRCLCNAGTNINNVRATRVGRISHKA